MLFRSAQIKPVQPMSLADMVHMARGVQAYQQAQQINPLEVQRAQAELSRLQQLTPEEVRKAQAEANVAVETQKPRIEKSKSEAETADAQAQAAKLKLAFDQTNGIASRITALYTNEDVLKAAQDPIYAHQNAKKLADLMYQYGQEQASSLGLPPDKANQLIAPYVNQALSDPQGLHKFLEGKQLSAMDAVQRLGAVQPKGVEVRYGTGTALVDTNKLSPTFGKIISGTQTKAGLPPTVYTTETGAPGVIGSTQGGIVNPPAEPTAPRPVSAAPVAPITAAQTAPQPAVTAKPVTKASGGLQRGPDETYSAFQERVGRLTKLPTVANTALNMSFPESVPQMEYTNDKVLRLLEKPGLDIGPLSDAIAKKTGGIGLSADQQEVIKYLEQRIRQQATRTDQDQASIRSAFGSFGTNKEALRDIIYNDKGTLASQRLYYQGIKKYQGNPNKPNLAAINEFENRFNELNQDPNISHLIGVVGTKKSNELSKSDVQHLKKTFGTLSPDQIQDLFDKRDALVNYVKGGQ